LKLKLIALNLALLGGIGAVVWQGRVRLHESRVKRRTDTSLAVKSAPVPPITPATKVEPVVAAKYVDVATKDLFSKDRNPVVVPEPPKVEAPKPMPPLPVLYGVLGLAGGTRALMAEKMGVASKPVHAGDTIGEFKIVSLDPQSVVFDWDGKQISRKIEDLIDRSSRTEGGAQPGPAAVQSQSIGIAPQQQSQQQQQGNQPQQPAYQPGQPGPGVEVGAPGQSSRACRQGDNSPAGTVVDGYRKTVSATPFGNSCRWVPAQ